MFRRKSTTKGNKGRGGSKAKKAVKRLLEKPTPDRVAIIADLAAQENAQPFSSMMGSGLGDAGACDAVAIAMAMYPDHRLIQVEGCRAVEALADGDADNVDRLGQADCCQLVEKALARFPNDANLQTQGCRAVTNLFSGEANTRQLGKGQACELVTGALRSFPIDHEVQIEACGAVANLANNSKGNRVKLGRAGACDLVTKSMGTFPDNIDVQHAACVAVGNLANRHAENKKRLGMAGACNKVCAALAGFQGDLGVQYMGCGAVGNLSNSNAQNCTRLGEAGGCLLVTGGMNAFPDDRNLQHVGCAAVANLAIGNAPNAGRLVKAGARLAVQRAMDLFLQDEEIQTRGSQALRWLSTTPRGTTSQSMKKLTGPETGRKRGTHPSRNNRMNSGASSIASRGRGNNVRAASVPYMSKTMDAAATMGRNDSGSMTEDFDTSMGEEDYTSTDDHYTSQGDGGMSSDDEESMYDGASDVSSVRPSGMDAVPLGEVYGAKSSVEAVRTVAPTAQPPAKTQHSRPPSKAELPMGALLEDFDSDGDGHYPAPPNPTAVVVTEANVLAVGGVSEQVAGGGKVAVGPSPPGIQAPTPGVLSSGGDPASAAAGHSSYQRQGNDSQAYRSGQAAAGGGNNAAGGNPATKPHGSGNDGHGDPYGAWNGDARNNTGNGKDEMKEEGGRGQQHHVSAGRGHRRHGSTSSRRSNGSAGSERGVRRGGGGGSREGDGVEMGDRRVGGGGGAMYASKGGSSASSRMTENSQQSVAGGVHSYLHEDKLRMAAALASQQSTRSNTSRRSFGSSRSSKSGRSNSHRRRLTAQELLQEPAMASAPGVAELLTLDESLASAVGVIAGRDPSAFSGILANVEQLVQRSRQMELVTIKVRRAVMSAASSPFGESLRRREYFDLLYTGLCGAHIAAAVVARGGIVATSKDGWLRKASALVKVVTAACPIVKTGVGLLGKALQLAERTKMADYLEQVAKASKSPADVSLLMEHTAMRLIREGRAETNAASLDAAQALEEPTDEWLPAWLLEEGAVEVILAGRSEMKGARSARRASFTDGCAIIKAIGNRSLRRMVTQEEKVETLMKAVMRAGGVDGYSGRPGAGGRQGRRSRDRQPMNPPVSPSRSMASTANYPPISPSTLPPGQGAAPSPTGSAIGALRRAEEVAARDAVVTKDAAKSRPAVEVVVAAPSLPSADVVGVAGGVIKEEEEEVAGGVAVGSGSGSGSGPSGVSGADASSAVDASASAAPVVKKLTVPDVFKQAMKPVVRDVRGHGDSGSVAKGRWEQAAAKVKAGGGVVGAKQAGKKETSVSSVVAPSAAPAEPGSRGGSRAAAGAGGGQATGARGRGTGGAVGPKGRASTASSSSTGVSADADDKPQRAGPRPLRVAGRGGQRGVSAAKQRAALGLGGGDNDSNSDARPRGSPKSWNRSPQSADRRAGGESRSPSRKNQPSPNSGGAAASASSSSVRGGRKSLAAAQKSWGRSGSWYEPRRRDIMSQSSVAASSYRSHRSDAVDGTLKEEEDDSEEDEEDNGGEGWAGKSKEDSLIDSMLDGVVAGIGAGEDTYFNRKNKKALEANAAATEDKSAAAAVGGGDAAWRNRSAKATTTAYDAVDAVGPGSLVESSAAPSVSSSGGGDGVYQSKSSGKITDKLATFGSAVRLAVSGVAGGGGGQGGGGGGGGGSGIRADDSRSVRSGRSRSSRRRNSSRGSVRSRSRSIAPEEGEEAAPHSPAGYAHAATEAAAGRHAGWSLENSDASAGRGGRRSAGRERRREESSDGGGGVGGGGGGGRPGREVWSPASSKRSASSRLSNFLSGSAKNLKAKEAEAAARDTFGSSDGDSDNIEAPFGHRRVSSRGSTSSLGLRRESYTVPPTEGIAHVRGASTTSVSELIKKVEQSVEQQTSQHVRQASSGSTRWSMAGRR